MQRQLLSRLPRAQSRGPKARAVCGPQRRDHGWLAAPAYFRNLAINTAPAKNNTAENENAACTETSDHNNPTMMLERKSPAAFTAASVPKAMPCCCFGKSSAASESSSASSVPT